MGPGQYPRYTIAVKDGRPWVAQATDKAAKQQRNTTGTRSTLKLSHQSLLNILEVVDRMLEDWPDEENYFISGRPAQSCPKIISTVICILVSNTARPIHNAALMPERSQTRLRGAQLDAKDRQASAGLRSTAEAVSRVPSHTKLGSILSQRCAHFGFRNSLKNVQRHCWQNWASI